MNTTFSFSFAAWATGAAITHKPIPKIHCISFCHDPTITLISSSSASFAPLRDPSSLLPLASLFRWRRSVRLALERPIAIRFPRRRFRLLHLALQASQFCAQFAHRASIGGIVVEVLDLERILLAVEQFPIVDVRLIVVHQLVAIGDHAIVR